MKTGIIGAGRVGCSLGKYFRSKNADLVGYYDTNAAAAKEAAAFTREFDTLKSKKVPQSLEIGLYFCQIFIFIV